MAHQPVGHPARGLDHAVVHGGGVDRDVGPYRRGHLGRRFQLDPVEAAGVGDRALVQSPQPAQQRDQFLHAHRGGLGRRAVPVVHHPLGPRAQPQHQPTAGELVQAACLGRDRQRRTAHCVSDRAAHPRGRGRAGDVSQRHNRGAGVELRRPHGVEPRRLRLRRGCPHVAHIPLQHGDAAAGQGWCAGVRGHRSSNPCGGVNTSSRPPLTLTVWPVRYAAASEARKATVAATSAGSASRRKGIARIRASRSFGFSPTTSANNAVSVGPGHTQLTFTPCRANSRAKVLVNAMIPPLAAE